MVNTGVPEVHGVRWSPVTLCGSKAGSLVAEAPGLGNGVPRDSMDAFVAFPGSSKRVCRPKDRFGSKNGLTKVHDDSLPKKST